jgi:hypothetical protein
MDTYDIPLKVFADSGFYSATKQVCLKPIQHELKLNAPMLNEHQYLHAGHALYRIENVYTEMRSALLTPLRLTLRQGRVSVQRRQPTSPRYSHPRQIHKVSLQLLQVHLPATHLQPKRLIRRHRYRCRRHFHVHILHVLLTRYYQNSFSRLTAPQLSG